MRGFGVPRSTTPRGRAVGLAAALILILPSISAPTDGPGAKPGASPVERDRAAVRRAEEGAPGLPPMPPHPPLSPEKVRVGRKLFLDRRLSRNGTMSCASCHVPEQGFTSHEMKTAVGLEGKSLTRNSPTLLNVAWAGPFFLDGREPSLDTQAFDVLINPDEMGLPSLGAVVQRVRELPGYDTLFREAFGGPPTLDSIGEAFGAYMRTLVAADSPFDRWRYGGNPDALNASARRGFELFTGKAGCSACHRIGDDHALFTDGEFHDTGIGWRSARASESRAPVRIEIAPGVFREVSRELVESVGERLPPDPGRLRITGNPEDRWRFKTPSLRNVALTAPYMHDGSFATLREVVDYYDGGAAPHPGLDPRLRPLGLTETQKTNLVAFLRSLTGSSVPDLVADARSETVGRGAPTE